MFYAGFDLLFSILFPILFLVVLGMILYTIIGNISTWNKNNHSPRLTVPATVVAKRTEVSRHHTDNTMMHTFTTYYVTFQVESGDRMELTVSGSDYGMLVEGDIGKLSFQGTRYLGFERNEAFPTLCRKSCCTDNSVITKTFENNRQHFFEPANEGDEFS